MIEEMQLKGKFTVELVKSDGRTIKLGEAENIIETKNINELIALRKNQHIMITQQFNPIDIIHENH